MVETYGATRANAGAAGSSAIGSGRVVQVNVSAGGVPKLAVPSARVGRLGLEGDTQAHRGVHGGPHRAVCLLAIEVIRRVAAEGHPIVPGSVGENLTTEGVELALLEPGTRLRFDGGLELELSAPANPCDTIRGSFSDGKSGPHLDPASSRATRASTRRVLTEATVDSRRGLRGPAAAARYDRRAPRPARAPREARGPVLGGDLGGGRGGRGGSAAARPGRRLCLCRAGYPGLIFNRAFGLRMVPNLRPVIVDHFRANGVPGWLVDVEPPTRARRRTRRSPCWPSSPTGYRRPRRARADDPTGRRR